MKHFNYFSEIEEVFVRRRGRNLLISPVDWALIEDWEKKGIPLKIVLSVINDIFDQIDGDPARSGQVRSLTYFRDAVDSRYASWRDSQVGKEARAAAIGSDAADQTIDDIRSEYGSGIFPVNAVDDHLESVCQIFRDLAQSFGPDVAEILEAACEFVERRDEFASDQKGLAERLEDLDDAIDSALLRSMAESRVREMEGEIRSELGKTIPFSGVEGHESAVKLLLKKRLRNESGLARLGLFYL